MSTPITKEEAFARLGAITREMHEALALIGQSQLHSVVSEIPDARDRLSYVARMTEDAANKVLNCVDEAKPKCDALARRGRELTDEFKLKADTPGLSVDDARNMLLVCAKFAAQAGEFSVQQGNTLGDIMMAQDFQDLSGQVIKRVTDVITRTEAQLLRLLIDSAPESLKLSTPNSLPASTAPHSAAQEETEAAGNALQQSDVDDLLASLGF